MGGLEQMTEAVLAFGWSTALRATVVLLGAAGLSWLVRDAGGRARHRLWSVTFALLLALPLLGPLLPPLPVPLPRSGWGPVEEPALAGPVEDQALAGPPERGPEAPSPGPGMGRVDGMPAEAPAPGPVAVVREGGTLTPAEVAPEGATSGPAVPAGAGLVLLWLTGALLGIGAVASGLRRAGLVAGAAMSPPHPAWDRALDRASLRLGIRRPVALRFTRAVTTPMAGGIVRPFILLPAHALRWTAERRDMVLAHELVHVARDDVLRQAVTRLTAALYWFHPLVWWAARQAALAREEACDETVLTLGHRASSYARHLLELAEPEALPLPALSRLERPDLERRLVAILRPSGAPRRRWTAATAPLCVALWTLSVAAASPTSAVPGPEGEKVAAAPAPELPVPIAGEVPGRPAPEATPAAAAAPLAPPFQDETCWADGFHGNYSGTLSQRTDESGTVTYERFGTADGDRVVQTTVDGLPVCMRAHGPVDFSDDMTRIRSLGDGAWVVLEAFDEEGTQRLWMAADGGTTETRWSVGGVERPFDAGAREWRDAMLEVLGARWQITRIRGQVSSLRGEISSVRGRQSSLRGEIYSIRGHVSSLNGEISSARGRQSSMNGEISSIRGQVSSMNGEISSIHGQVSSLRGEISTLRGRISSLQSARSATEDDQTRARLSEEIEALEAAIADVERRIEAFDEEGKVAAVEARLAAFDAEARVQEVEARRRQTDVEARVQAIQQEIADYDADARIREVEQRIRDLDVDGQVARIQEEIEALDADRRVEELEGRLEGAVRRLNEAVRAVR